MNYWFWLFLLSGPVFTFCAKPETAPMGRIMRLLVGVFACYVFANLGLHFANDRDLELYEACQNQFEDGYRVMHDECHVHNSGADYAFYFYLGWIPSAAYIGLWESLWRIVYRKRIKAMGGIFKGRWASDTVIGFTLLCALYPIIALLYWSYKTNFPT